MSRWQHNQSGFGVIEVLGVIVVVGLIVIVGLRLTGVKQSSNPSLNVSHAAVPAKINSPADVVKATAALNATNVNSGVDATQLDSDLNSVL